MNDPPRRARWNVAAAIVVLAAGAVVSWASVLGSGLLAIAPVVLAAALVAAGRIPARWAAALAVAWIPSSLVLAGVPGAVLKPRNWDLVPGLLGDGWSQLATPERGLITGDPWPLAAGLIAIGLLWLAGATTAAWGRPAPPREMLAFAVLTLPMVVSIALQQSDDGAWQGGIVLASAMMWLSSGRAGLAVALGACVALVATTATAAIGPHDRWLVPGSLIHETPAFSTLNTAQTYGPLSSRRTGATMLEVTSAQPALWRMQVLDWTWARGWVDGQNLDPLPEPAAVTEKTTVKVAKLRNDLLIAPGLITAVESAKGRDIPATGEGRRLTPAPQSGDTYTVRSRVVRTTVAQLRRAPTPEPAALGRYTFATQQWEWDRYGSKDHGGVGGPPFDNRNGVPTGTGSTGDYQRYQRSTYADRWGQWGQVMALANDLAAGAKNQFEVVARVQHYLQSSRFTYTTDVPVPTAQPLMDFLFVTHRGYCQHFAGAAALLLRMVGVPSRVVVGFATGEKTSDGHYRVRDQDAHAWIEVYFQGIGWVPFNPTPAAAAAMVPAGVDLTAPLTANPIEAGGGGGTWLGIVAAILVAGAGAEVLRRRRRRMSTAPPRDLPAALERVAPRVGVPLRPDHTFTQLRQELLARVGPHLAALTDEASRARYGVGGADAGAAERHPTARVWGAVLRDLGPWRTLTSLLHSPGRGPVSRR